MENVIRKAIVKARINVRKGVCVTIWGKINPAGVVFLVRQVRMTPLVLKKTFKFGKGLPREVKQSDQ